LLKLKSACLNHAQLKQKRCNFTMKVPDHYLKKTIEYCDKAFARKPQAPNQYPGIQVKLC